MTKSEVIIFLLVNTLMTILFTFTITKLLNMDNFCVAFMVGNYHAEFKHMYKGGGICTYHCTCRMQNRKSGGISADRYSSSQMFSFLRNETDRYLMVASDYF